MAHEIEMEARRIVDELMAGLPAETSAELMLAERGMSGLALVLNVPSCRVKIVEFGERTGDPPPTESRGVGRTLVTVATARHWTIRSSRLAAVILGLPLAEEVGRDLDWVIA